MKTILKVTLPCDECVLKSEFIMPEKKLTFDEASWIMVVLNNLIFCDLMNDEKVKEIFQSRHIIEYSIGYESETSCEKSCMPQKVPAQIQDL
jgi:hypothetical protein